MRKLKLMPAVKQKASKIGHVRCMLSKSSNSLIFFGKKDITLLQSCNITKQNSLTFTLKGLWILALTLTPKVEDPHSAPISL